MIRHPLLDVAARAAQSIALSSFAKFAHTGNTLYKKAGLELVFFLAALLHAVAVINRRTDQVLYSCMFTMCRMLCHIVRIESMRNKG